MSAEGHAGCAAVALTPNVKVSAVISSNFYSLANLFAGFVAPRPVSLLLLLLLLVCREVHS